MAFGPTKGGNLCYVKTHNVIRANQQTESFLFRWLRAHATYDVTCLFAFVEASDVIDTTKLSLSSCVSCQLTIESQPLYPYEN